MRLALAFCCLALPVSAGVDAALTDHILPGFDGFAAQTAALSDAAQSDCTQPAMQAPYQAAFDAWMGISHLTFGPLEAEGRALTIAFWPDTRGILGRTVDRLIRDQDAAVNDPAAFAEVSVAGRGLFALERLLYETAPYAEDSYACRYAQALSADLARIGAEMRSDWDGHAALLRSAGENRTYLSEAEALSTLYTALVTGLDFTADQRLGRPLGTFDRPRPTRAEARRSGRSLRNVILSLEALRGLARSFTGVDLTQTEAAFADALEIAAGLDDPVLAGVADPAARLRIEILQQRVDFVRDAVAAEIGTALGLAAGFNSADGD